MARSMKQTHAPRKEDMTMRGRAPKARLPFLKRNGGGPHQDRRINRQGTRQARFSAALRD